MSKRSSGMREAHAALDEVEAEVHRRLQEAQQVREEARRESANQRHLGRRNHFGPMILDLVRGHR